MLRGYAPSFPPKKVGRPPGSGAGPSREAQGQGSAAAAAARRERAQAGGLSETKMTQGDHIGDESPPDPEQLSEHAAKASRRQTAWKEQECALRNRFYDHSMVMTECMSMSPEPGGGSLQEPPPVKPG